MTCSTTSPARDSEVLEFWSLNAKWHHDAAEALKAYLG